MTTQHPYEFKLIRADLICVDRRYQRDAQTPMIRHIVSNFDYHQVKPVQVVFRDGYYYAFDGQQTTSALLQKFGDDYLVPCMVYYDVASWIDEAKLFEGINAKDARKAVSEGDRWVSRIARGDEVAHDITKIAERNGFRIKEKSGNRGSGVIRSINALDAIYAKYGRDILEETLNVISGAWHGEPISLQSPLLRGMAIFVSRYHADYDKKRLIRRLEQYGAANIIRAGRSSAASGNVKYAREILAVYNNNAKTKLPDLI